MTTVAPYEIRRAGPRIGAEVKGIDFKAGIDRAVADALVEEFLAYKVLVFRDQHLSADEHVRAARIFGEPFDHPTAVKDENNPLAYPYNVRTTGKASTWHVGGLWRNPPFSIESLSYQEVSDLGGDTLWADLQAAYDDLSEPLRQLLESVSAVYDADAANYAQGSKRDRIHETVEHPVVLRHPDTGRPGLFISSSALRLTGISAEESKALLPFLLKHASSPNYTIRFGWRPGDFVLWDNLATWHYAVDDYGDAPRVYRKVIATR